MTRHEVKIHRRKTSDTYNTHTIYTPYQHKYTWDTHGQACAHTSTHAHIYTYIHADAKNSFLFATEREIQHFRHELGSAAPPLSTVHLLVLLYCVSFRPSSLACALALSLALPLGVPLPFARCPELAFRPIATSF